MAILVFGVGQLVLPPLAEHIERDRLAKTGRVLSLSISAFPAVELLFGDADTVKAHLASFDASQTQLANNIGQSSGVTNIDVKVDTVTSGPVTVSDVTMTKHDGHYSGTGLLTEASLRRSIPLLQSVTPIASSGGAVTLQGTTASLPLIGSITADATVAPENGHIVVSGDGVLGSFLHLTAWSSPKVYVESLSGKPAPQGISLAATWKLG